MNQLGLPISLNTSMLLESFVANKELLRLINQLFVDENSSEVFIYGASGQGKTHILQGAVLMVLVGRVQAFRVHSLELLSTAATLF